MLCSVANIFHDMTLDAGWVTVSGRTASVLDLVGCINARLTARSL